MLRNGDIIEHMKCCQSRPQQIHREREAVLTFCHASYPRELDQGGSRCLVMLISIGYVLRMERDDFVVDAESFEAIFQSTRSAWSATPVWFPCRPPSQERLFFFGVNSIACCLKRDNMYFSQFFLFRLSLIIFYILW